MGDDGQVGRGNRVNCLITPARPMSLEAAAGKNPVGHIGKIYNLLAREVAQMLCAALPELREAQVYLLGTIGAPLEVPGLAMVEVAPRGSLTPAPRRKVADLAAAQIAAVGRLTGAAGRWRARGVLMVRQ
jgi:S-adenosylmethionine synthetase